MMRQCFGRIVNVDLSDHQGLQANLTVPESGLGVRAAAPLALSDYMTSAASTRDLQDLILADKYTCLSRQFYIGMSRQINHGKIYLQEFNSCFLIIGCHTVTGHDSDESKFYILTTV